MLRTWAALAALTMTTAGLGACGTPSDDTVAAQVAAACQRLEPPVQRYAYFATVSHSALADLARRLAKAEIDLRTYAEHAGAKKAAVVSIADALGTGDMTGATGEQIGAALEHASAAAKAHGYACKSLFSAGYGAHIDAHLRAVAKR